MNSAIAQNDFRRFAKRHLAAAFPAFTARITAVRARRHSHRYYREVGLRQIGATVRERYGDTVQTGPFLGLKLPDMVFAEHIAPYLIGCYEDELHAPIEEVIGIGFSCCVDIGAKFGYYAVGLSR